jgi:hypothetical protein
MHVNNGRDGVNQSSLLGRKLRKEDLHLLHLVDLVLDELLLGVTLHEPLHVNLAEGKDRNWESLFAESVKPPCWEVF